MIMMSSSNEAKLKITKIILTESGRTIKGHTYERQ
jgi:hypothetical protein